MYLPLFPPFALPLIVQLSAQPSAVPAAHLPSVLHAAEGPAKDDVQDGAMSSAPRTRHAAQPLEYVILGAGGSPRTSGPSTPKTPLLAAKSTSRLSPSSSVVRASPGTPVSRAPPAHEKVCCVIPRQPRDSFLAAHIFLQSIPAPSPLGSAPSAAPTSSAPAPAVDISDVSSPVSFLLLTFTTHTTLSF